MSAPPPTPPTPAIASAAGAPGALALPTFRLFLTSAAAASFAGRSLAVVIGFQVYQLTKDPLALGLLGLFEAIPAVSLALFGGYIADQFNRRSIALVTRIAQALCVLALTMVSLSGAATSVAALYAVIFLAGIARGFADPAVSGLEAQIVPRAQAINAGVWLSSANQTAAVLGPAAAGFAYDGLGPVATYAAIATLYGLCWLALLLLPRPPTVRHGAREPMWQSIGAGVRFVFSSQIFLGAMALDLFAVLFGGAMALMPVFASDILQVGARGLGFLSAAPAVGALAVMIWSTRWPPMARAGRNLLTAVAGFGVAMIVFGLSSSFWLSLVALMLSGVFDGVSVVIRRAILRLLSPDAMRGRIAAVNAVFIGSSNELGALESGVAASLLGARAAVWLGGCLTLLIVAGAAWRAPDLRRLRIEAYPIRSS
ncbi:MAG: MFS transporter [Alphaproteobacteria bacterium]|nr:MFS transporter [Alphaproteobacteria bacterium]